MDADKPAAAEETSEETVPEETAPEEVPEETQPAIVLIPNGSE